MADHQRHAGALGRGDDVAAFVGGGRDRLLHHHMNAARDAGERDLVMEVRGRGDGDGVDPAVEQGIDLADGDAAERPGDEIRLLAIGIGHADEFYPWKLREHARMVAAHHADADYSHTQQRFRAVLRGSIHDPPDPL